MLKLVNEQDHDFYSGVELEILAKTIWGETRKSHPCLRRAIANVIMNRVSIADDQSIIQICQKPYQFSCWNRSSPEYKKIRNVTEKKLSYLECLKIAEDALLGRLIDITHGSTHYHDENTEPFWAKGEAFNVQIENIKFYKLV